MRLGKSLIKFIFDLRNIKSPSVSEVNDEIENVSTEQNNEVVYFVGFLILLMIESLALYSLFVKWFKEKKDNDNPKNVLPITISELTIYPLKSCKGIKVLSADVSPTGFEYDRTFMIINEKDGKFVSQRKYPLMSKVATELTKDTLIIKDPNNKLSDLVVPLSEPIAKKTRTVTVWGDACEAYDCGESAAVWICKTLGAKYGFPSGCSLRLVRLASSYIRKTPEKYAPVGGEVGFADGFPFLIASNASLEAVNHKLIEKYGDNAQLVTMAHFRPNIVVDNCDAFDEDAWREIKIRDMIFKVCKPCARCTIPNVDPDTGTFRTDNEPTLTLRSFRKGKMLNLNTYDNEWDGQVFFGQNLDHGGKSGVTICVEDVVSISA